MSSTLARTTDAARSAGATAAKATGSAARTTGSAAAGVALRHPGKTALAALVATYAGLAKRYSSLRPSMPQRTGTRIITGLLALGGLAYAGSRVRGARRNSYDNTQA
jgi:hypothetical protein